MSFKLDPFQQEAINFIHEGRSVLICAPTGAGKTLIAEAAIEQCLKNNQNIIYTAPIKALSNQKYRDFIELYGEEKVGILTGDVSIRADASILIMTTEIYRNSLFEISDRIRNTGWVIFDEIHYLDDAERGTVWEEAILFTPPEIRILALSATAPNVDELAEWMHEIHKQPIEVVHETHRPVPLDFVFQCQGKFHETKRQLRQNGYLTRESWQISRTERRRGMRVMRAKPNRLDALIRNLKEHKRFPVIYFSFGRRRTETLAYEATAFNFLTKEKKEQVQSLYDELLERYGLSDDRTAQDMRLLVEQGIAYHHAGMLPSLKEVIERLFTSRLVQIIFTTETFALGINMPARCVVFDELDKYYGTGFRHLTTRDFYQMAGRAGRRGMDDKGYVYIRVNPNHINYQEVLKIIYGEPETIRSQLNATYATLLNLYQQFGERLLDIYPTSFHHWQSSKKRRKRGFQLIENKLNLLRDLKCIADGNLTDKGRFTASLFGYELILAEMYFEGVLDPMDSISLCSALSGLIFEPRKGDHPPKLSHRHLKIQKMMSHYHQSIHRKESKHRVFPYTKPPHFNLVAAVEAWAQGTPFEKLFRLTTVDEGELVRHIRMIIQLLRELRHASGASQEIRSSAQTALEQINRDVIDAEKQLRS